MVGKDIKKADSALIFQNRFAFTNFFRNFGRICRISLYKGDAED